MWFFLSSTGQVVVDEEADVGKRGGGDDEIGSVAIHSSVIIRVEGSLKLRQWANLVWR
jgi:hypothetical protein